MRVLVCGGRDYDDRDHVWNTLCELDATRGPFSVVHASRRVVSSGRSLADATPKSPQQIQQRDRT